MKNTVCTALMLLMSVCMYAQELYGEYEKKVYVSSQGDSLKYRLLRPEAEKAGKKYPLVLFLHGAGERGDDVAQSGEQRGISGFCIGSPVS